MDTHRTAISLFTSGGIGDLAVRKSGFDLRVSNELLEDRHSVFAHNFKSTLAITGDVWGHRESIVDASLGSLGQKELDLFFATPPCQGMSKNGRGKLLNAIRAGVKPAFDERNRLIIPTMDVAARLDPITVVLENVPEMAETVIVDDSGEVVSIVEYVRRCLGSRYVGGGEVVEFANYGVPQRRQRLITIFSRDQRMIEWWKACGSFIPEATHAVNGTGRLKPWVTVREAIRDFPPLDARSDESAVSQLPFHRVPVLDEMKYWWVASTPPEKGAFDNQCVDCGFEGNATHVAKRDAVGINRTSRETPLFCQRCGALLPRPSVERDGQRKLMSGFTSAYRRMSFDKPATALTRNLSYACSDNKLHPDQHRVLSLREAFRLHTIDSYPYEWERADGKKLSDKTIREIIGESIPPLGLQAILDHVVSILDGRLAPTDAMGPLFAISSNE